MAQDAPPLPSVGADGITVDLNGHSWGGVWASFGTSGHSYVTIENGSFGPSKGTPLWMSGGHYDVVRNVKAGSLDGDGVSLSGGSNNTVVDSTLYGGIAQFGVDLRDGENNDVIDGNSAVGVIGIWLDHSAGGGNQITNNTAAGIEVAGSEDTIEANTVSGAVNYGGFRGLQIDGNTNQVIGNDVISWSGVDGVRVTGIGNVLSGNTANSNGGDGIHVLAAGNTLVANVANNNGAYGIEAVAGVFDGGQNRASGNANSPQCVHVKCSPVPVTTVPSVPTGLTATPGNGSVSLSWKANPAGDAVSHYNVYRTDQWFDGPWASPTGTSFLNASNVLNGTTYCYDVSASNAAGESGRSAPVCATPTGPKPSVPSVPTGVTASPGDGSVTVSWDPNPGGEKVTHYNVYRTDQTYPGPWAMPTGTSFTNASNVVNGHRYCYVVSASNGAGEGGKSAPVCATPTGPQSPVPGVPTGLSIAGGIQGVTVTWQPNPGSDELTHYTVYRTGPRSSSTSTSVITTAYVDVLVIGGVPYCYQVSASNLAGESTATAPICVTAPEIIVRPSGPPPPPTITGQPTNGTTSTTARFTFTDSKLGVQFDCQLDRGPFTACASPKVYTGLRIGKHTFRLIALTSGRQSDPATYTWTVAAKYKLTVANAGQWARSAVITRLYGARKSTKLTGFRVFGCVKLSGGRLRCRVSWRKVPYSYSGTITLGNLNPTTGKFQSSLSLVRRNTHTGIKKRITLRY